VNAADDPRRDGIGFALERVGGMGDRELGLDEWST
jgi:hypothetical protein